jgi:hypothetical protein
MLDPKLLEILACPQCKGELKVDAEHTVLDCLECRLRFKVRDGIPIMLLDEAESLTEDGRSQ